MPTIRPSSGSRRTTAALALLFAAVGTGSLVSAPATAAGKITLSASARDRADGDRALPKSGGTVVDKVTYTGLSAGTTYSIKAELFDPTTGEATGISARRDFTPTGSHGSVSVRLAVPASMAGRTLVVYDTVKRDGQPVATFRDPRCAHQTITVGAGGEADTPTAMPTQDTTATNGPNLPVTGASVGNVVGVGVVGLGLGAMLLLSARRRKIDPS